MDEGTEQPQAGQEPVWPEDLEAADDTILDAVGQRLGEVRHLPPPEHAAVYHEIHRGLQESLAEVDGG